MDDLYKKIETLCKEHGINITVMCKKAGVPRSTLSDYKAGRIKSISTDKLAKIANFFDVSIDYLLGNVSEPFFYLDNERILRDINSYYSDSVVPDGFSPIPETEKKPLVGRIACGDPILAESNIESYVDVPKGKGIDFCLTCKGDSMIEAGIFDGDIVYIKKQPEVENGEIAAVRIENEATLKRVYVYSDYVMLQPANSSYQPIVISKEKMNDITIEGKAVGFTHWF